MMCCMKIFKKQTDDNTQLSRLEYLEYWTHTNTGADFYLPAQYR